MTEPSKRPADLAPPRHLSPSPPVPEPEAVTMPPDPRARAGDGLPPTRYGDWEKDGMAIDF